MSAKAIKAAKQLMENGFIFLDAKTLVQPAHWKRPRRIFVCSMTDLFGEWVPGVWIDKVFAVMALSPQHTFQVLTKRAGRMRAYLTDGAFGSPPTGNLDSTAPDSAGRIFREMGRIDPTDWSWPGWPLPNVWCGVSVESDAFTWRARMLADTPAAVRFVSAEPLLGPLPSLRFTNAGWAASLSVGIECTHGRDVCPICDGGRSLDWLIVGGESNGPPERRLVEPCTNRSEVTGRHPSLHCATCGVSEDLDGAGPWKPKGEALAWVRDLRDRATRSGAAFLLKQWGGPRPKSGGRRLDGVVWDEFPAARTAVPA
jgi:protein gp37